MNRQALVKELVRGAQQACPAAPEHKLREMLICRITGLGLMMMSDRDYRMFVTESLEDYQAAREELKK